jgi:hypothetical protein
MVQLAFYYLRWHYTQGVIDLVNNIINFLWFVYNFFSIPLLLRTFFVPFHRLQETAVKGFNIEQWAQALLVTTLMRLVGALLRTFLIAIGIIFLVAVFTGGSILLLAWLTMPLLLTFLVGLGLTLVGFM